MFNSLNVLSSLVYQDAEKANLYAKRLSSVCRYLLTTQKQPTVGLEEELQFVNSYLFLEQIRFGENLVFSVDGKNERHRTIIPASLQLLAENAIKHNVCTAKSPLIIRITVTENVVVVTNNLQLRNYVVGSGVGIKNLERQYAIYGKEIKVTTSKDEFTVNVPFVD